MKTFKKYFKIVLGSLMIGAAINLFFVQVSYIPSGVFGLSFIYSYKMHVSLGATVLGVNLFCFALALYVYPYDYLKKTSITFWLIPLFIILTKV